MQEMAAIHARKDNSKVEDQSLGIKKSTLMLSHCEGEQNKRVRRTVSPDSQIIDLGRADF
jgi:hypothetical protein